MVIALLSLLLLATTSALFFVAPHHHRRTGQFRACTLSEIYRQFFEGIPESATPHLPLLLLLAGMGLVAAFYPLFWFWLSRFQGGSRQGLIIGGAIAGAGAWVNWFAMIVSDLNLSWGLSSSKRNKTVFFRIIPVLQLSVAGASMALGFCSIA